MGRHMQPDEQGQPSEVIPPSKPFAKLGLLDARPEMPYSETEAGKILTNITRTESVGRVMCLLGCVDEIPVWLQVVHSRLMVSRQAPLKP